MVTDSIRQLLVGVTAVTDLVGQRIWVSAAPQRSTLPHIIITRIGEDPLLTLSGPTGGMASAEVDIDCYAATPALAGQVASAVQSALNDYKGTAGDVTINGVWKQSENDEYIQPQHGDEPGRHVTGLSYTIDYT